MAYLIILLISLGFLVGFLVLTEYEMRRGVRVCSVQRQWIDEHAERAEFLFQHVDLSGFVRSEIERVVARVGHDLVHLSLQVVRAVERLLTRAVRYLRSRHATDEAPREQAREFVKTLADFKGSLKATHPEVSDIK